jgi:hypothetical protein
VPTHRIAPAVSVARAVIASAFAVVALVGVPDTAAAAPPVHETSVFSIAGAAHNECVGTLCTSTSAYVSSSSSFQSQVCVDIQRYEMSASGIFTPLSFESGCAPIADGTFSIDTKTLSGATLTSTSVRLDEVVCDQTGCQPTGASRIVEVSATYSGVGGIDTFRGNSKGTFGECTMFFNGRGNSRQAVASLTINGATLDATGFISTSTQKFKLICH